MANTAAQLQTLLGCQADYNFAILQQALWSSKQEANASKLAAQESAAEKWETAYESAYDTGYYGDDDDKISCSGITVKAGCKNVSLFSAYADAKVSAYNADALEEYSDLDTEYDLMVSTYDTMVDELSSMIENLKESVSSAAQDTGLLSS